MSKTIYVATSSQSRKDLAKAYQLDWKFIDNKFDEENEKHNYKIDNFINACKYTKKLAYGKAKSVENDVNGIVIACDSVVYIKGQVLEKPKNRADFDKMISMLCKYPHQLITGVCIVDTILDKCICFNEITKLYFDNITDYEKEILINEYHAFDNAGGYTIDSVIKPKVHIIKGTRDNVIGLPIKRILFEISAM